MGKKVKSFASRIIGFCRSCRQKAAAKFANSTLGRRVNKPVGFVLVLIAGILVIAIVYLLSWPGSFYTTHIEEKGAGKMKYTNDDLKFALTFPEQFELKQDGNFKKGTLEVDLSDADNGNVKLEVMDAETGLENYVEERIREIKKSNNVDATSRKIIITGVNGLMIEPYDAGGKKKVEAYLVKDGKMFVMSSDYDPDRDYFGTFTDLLMGLQLFRGDSIKM